MVNTDPECLKFKQDTPDNILLDKVITREIKIVDSWQKNGYVEIDTTIDGEEDENIDKDADDSPMKEEKLDEDKKEEQKEGVPEGPE